MNKRVFYLTMALLVIVSLFSAKIYFSTKKNILQENNRIVFLENKIKKVYALKNKYKFNQNLFNRLKKFCSINDEGDKYSISCKKLNSNNFNTVQNIIFKNNFKLQDFKIVKNKSADIKAEINK